MNISLRLSLVLLIIVLASIFLAPSHVAPIDQHVCPAGPDSLLDISFAYQQSLLHKGGGEYV